MPKVEVVFYQEEDETVPVLNWLEAMNKRDARIVEKCWVKIERLAEMGYELRRPEADYLRDDIYELRTRVGSTNYRILYFFHGREVAVLAHSLTKEDAVPDKEIEVAIKRSKKYAADPAKHRYVQETDDET
jgi:phage-related protein